MKINQIKIENSILKSNYEIDAKVDNEVQIAEGQSRNEQGPWTLWNELPLQSATLATSIEPKKIENPPQSVNLNEAKLFADKFVQEKGFDQYESITDKGNGTFEILWSGENPFHWGSLAFIQLGRLYTASSYGYSKNAGLDYRYWKLEVRSTTPQKLIIQESTWIWSHIDGYERCPRTIPVSGDLLNRFFSGYYDPRINA